MRALPDDDQLIRDLRDLRNLRDGLPDASAAWLFGSAAQGRLRADSDIDIDVAVRRTAPLQGLERYGVAGRLAGRLGRDVDLLDFNRLFPDALARFAGNMPARYEN